MTTTIGTVFRTQVPPVAGQVDMDTFRNTMATLPTAVSVVTALDQDGVPRGLTCSAVCSVSAEPAQILVCINQRNGSLDAIRSSGAFVVNILDSAASGLSTRFASASADKFDQVFWRPAPSSGLPVLTDAAHAFLDCGLVADITVGSHSVLVGAVHACSTDFESAHPLLFWRRAYGTWTAPAPRSLKEKQMTDEITGNVEEFVRRRFLDESDDVTLTRTSPLLEWGILTSMNQAILIEHIRATFGVQVPPMAITARNFRDLDSIGAMVTDLVATAPSPSSSN